MQNNLELNAETDNKELKTLLKEKEVTPLSQSLKVLYSAQDTIPKLIDDERIPAQKWSEYYIKLQMVLDKKTEGQAKAAANDKVEGKKTPIEMDDLFSSINKEQNSEKETEVSRVILLGGSGVGKTTLLDYIAYSWGAWSGETETPWSDKYDYVFRVHLKKLLNESWKDDYLGTKDFRSSRLGCFIDYCLRSEKKKIEQELKEKVKIPKHEISKIIRSKAEDNIKILLLADGYDEIKTNDETSKKVIDEIMKITKKNENISLILSSRSYAETVVKKQFDRSVEIQGFDYEGIKQYIKANFKENIALGQDLLSFITNNSQINNMCTVPINTALMCLIWGDPEVRQTLGKETEELNLSNLYDEVILWLGKRYTEKFDQTKTKEDIKETIKGDIFNKTALVLLKEVAYKSFVDTGKLVTKEVFDQSKKDLQCSDNIHAAQIDETAMSKVLKFGLLHPEGEHYQFIHLSFQEYLTACYLKEKLKNNKEIQDKKINYKPIVNDKGERETKEVETPINISAAEFIANHRNEPKYLMTLKFLAGLISNEEDGSLIIKFWDAVSCNIEGIIELGLENKVKLFMHLLAQSRVKGGEIDNRIPNLDKIVKVVDEEVVKDLSKWSQAIIESGYLSQMIIKTVKDIIEIDGMLRLEIAEQENNSSDNNNTYPIDKKNLTTALEIRSSLVNKKELGSKSELYETLLSLIKNEKVDWRLTNFALEKLLQITDETILTPRSQEQIAKDLQIIIKQMLSEANISDSASKVINKISNIKPKAKKEVYAIYQKVLTYSDNLVILQDKANVIKKLIVLIKTLDDGLSLTLFKYIFEFIKETTKNDLFKAQLINDICKIIKAFPATVQKEAAGQALQLIESLVSDSAVSNNDIKKSALYIVSHVLKTSRAEDKVDIANLTLQLIEKIINNGAVPDDVKEKILYTIPYILEASKTEDQEKIVEQAWQLIERIVNNDAVLDDVKKSAVRAMPYVLKAIRAKDKEEIAERTLKLIEKIASNNAVASDVKALTSYAIPHVLKAIRAEDKEKTLERVSELIERVITSDMVLNDIQYIVTSVIKESRVEDKEDLAKQILQLIERMINKDAVFNYTRALDLREILLEESNAETKEKNAKQALKLIEKIIKDNAVLNNLKCIKHGILDAVPSKIEISKDKEKTAEQTLKLMEIIFENTAMSERKKEEALDNVRFMEDTIKLGQGKTAEQALKLIEKIIKDDAVLNNLKYETPDAVTSRIEASSAEDKEKIAEQALQLIEIIIKDDAISEYVKERALNAIPSILKTSSTKDKEKTAEQDLQFIERIIKDELRYDVITKQLKERALYAVPSVLKVCKAEDKKKIAEQALKFIERIIKDKTILEYTKRIALNIVSSVLKTIKAEDKEEIADQAWQLIKKIISDNEVLSDVKITVISIFPSILKLMQPEQAIENLDEIVNVSNISNTIKNNFTFYEDKIREVLINIPLNHLTNLLKSSSTDLRKLTGIVLKTKLEENIKYTFEDLPGLLMIIKESKQAGAEQQELNEKAKGVVKDLGAEDVTDDQIKWLNKHFEEIEQSNVLEARLYLKAVCNAVLRDGVITEEKSQFMINCIIKLGFTSTIRLKECSILFEDVTYNIKEGAEYLTTIFEIVTKSDDALARQYRSHEPLFENKGKGLKIAAVDKHEFSLDTKTKLEIDKWYISLMHLSDHKFSMPSDVFVLMERRGELGEHLIYKIRLENDTLSVQEYTKFPDQINTEFRKEIFGEMVYDFEASIKPRYFGSSYEADLVKGEEIIEEAKKNNNPNEAETVNMWLVSFIDDVRREGTLLWENYIDLWEDATDFDEIDEVNIREFKRTVIHAEAKPEKTRTLSIDIDNKIEKEKVDEQIANLIEAVTSSGKKIPIIGEIELGVDSTSLGTDL